MSHLCNGFGWCIGGPYIVTSRIDAQVFHILERIQMSRWGLQRSDLAKDLLAANIDLVYSLYFVHYTFAIELAERIAIMTTH